MNVQLIIKYLHVGRYVSAFTILLVRQFSYVAIFTMLLAGAYPENFLTTFW